ncbi:Thioesterase/thiol ester dehydrase-isomerase [Lichtheimia hyalospora FSU 10163]|nr:Thioesterase/thiol ester dehydrase-isomerase [Lichtheimia hyalospora FSU 10163]
MASNARLAQVTRHLSPATNNTARSVSTKVTKAPSFRSRAEYKHFLPIQSRWSDNDQYGHINNSIYYFYIDTVVNEYLIRKCGLDPLDTSKTKPIGLVIASSANFYAPASYPNLLQAGLCITKIGRSSVTYRVGIFQGDEEQACVVGGFTHVFVDPIHRRPVKALPDNFKAGFEAIYVSEQ